MIRFRCRCNEPFEVPADQAGNSFQCPACGLLVDVPTIDDLPGLEETGGSYKLHEAPIDLADENGKSRRAVGGGADTPHVVARHDVKDRRMSLDDFLKIGTSDDDLLKIKGEVQPGVPTHPKYDPVTGELVVPLDVRVDPKAKAKAVPIVAAPAVLAYERRATGDNARSIWWPIVAMFQLPNFIVCLIVAAIHFGNMVATGAIGGFFFTMIVLLPIFMMVISHFANIVDETGPTATDEIPRPMRGGNGYDDFLKPLVQVFTAYLLAWIPIYLLNRYAIAMPWYTNLGLSLAFYAIVPALLITLITSGAVNNLLPHRAFSVISASGKDYWATALIGVLATYAFIISSVLSINVGYNIARLTFTGTTWAAFRAQPIFPVPMFVEIVVTPILVLGATYLVHVFCWQMGVIYRRHHARFNWVLQKHDKSSRTDTLAQLHTHRQRELEAKAAAARANMQQRVKPATPMPVAKPVEPRV